MLRRVRSHLTYANVMATVAVFIALGGASYAAITIPARSVGSAQLKANAVTSAKVRDGTLAVKDFSSTAALALQGKAGPAGPAGPAGAKGDAGAPGPGTVWALFNADGTVAEQSGGISLTSKAGSDYFINMGTSVAGHALLATVSQKGGGFGAKILAGLCGPAPDGQDCSPAIGATANGDGRHVHVFIADGTTSSPQPFYLVGFP